MVMIAGTSYASKFNIMSIRQSDITISDSEEESDLPNPIEKLEEPTSIISVWQWVVIRYDKVRYPGEVTDVDAGEKTVRSACDAPE